MNYLLDTHTFLWAAIKPKALSQHAEGVILDSKNDIHVSVVTFWEVSIKYALGKMDLNGIAPDELPDTLNEMGFSLLDLASGDAASFHRLPKLKHKDPFDRMLVWQAIRQEMTLVSRDSELKQYEEQGLNILW